MSSRRGRRTLLATMVAGVVLTGGLVASPASAISGGGLTATTWGCESVVLTHSTLTFDRDNTGSGRERYVIDIVDGIGTSLRHYDIARDVGVVLSPATVNTAFSNAPVANPLRITLTSIAGNGFDAQVVWDETGTCAGLGYGHPPVTVPADFTVVAGGSLSGSLDAYASDADGDDLTFSVVTAPSGGSLDLEPDGSFTYTPDSGEPPHGRVHGGRV